MGELSLSNVINISVSATPQGINAFNTSNLALFTYDTPAESFGANGYKIYKEPTEVGTDFGTASVTYKMALAAFSQMPNFLAANGSFIVIEMEPSETLAGAITRISGTVQFFGLMSSQIEIKSDVLDAAAVVQSMIKMAFIVQRDPSALTPSTGVLDSLRAGGYNRSRGLYYGADNDTDALLMQAAYAGRALSTIFSGSNTTQTMHMKDLLTIQPDLSLDQTKFQAAIDAGADTYPSFEGVPKVYSTGGNRFFDQIYNLSWFIKGLEVAGFNYLAQTGTKIPQTEAGMDGLKGAYRKVCQQAVTNSYAAPGAWNSPITFGNQQDLVDNISQFGYYIYSTPIAQQAQVDREARKAPLCQIALKEAGAIHESTVIININA